MKIKPINIIKLNILFDDTMLDKIKITSNIVD